jgi:protein-tyrosine-phosphatase
MPTILMVCTANQCRSPMAEVLLRDLLHHRGLDETLHVGSAGVWADEGRPATQFAQQAMQARRLDLQRHASQRVTSELLESAAVILAMSDEHRHSLQALFPEAASRVHLLSEMAGESRSIPDPVGGPLEGYLALADELADLLERGLPRLLALAGVQAPGTEAGPAASPPADGAETGRARHSGRGAKNAV